MESPWVLRVFAQWSFGRILSCSSLLFFLSLQVLLVVETSSFFLRPTTPLPTTNTNSNLPTIVLQSPQNRRHARTLAAAVNEESFAVQLNEFFKEPVPRPIKRSLSLYYEKENPQQNLDVISLLTAAPSVPGCPRPLWLVVLGSLPTGLLWYGYYKFAVEEELLQIELDQGKEPRGFGGYGTLGPFTYGLLLGPVAALLHLPGGMNWSALGVIFIYYTQFLLYDRVNELYTDQGRSAPLNVWWCLPIFFPFNLIVGLRQVHFLSQYFYELRRVVPAPNDPIADFFPFISADNFTWQDFFVTPSLWCSLLADTKSIDKNTLPSPLRDILTTSDK